MIAVLTRDQARAFDARAIRECGVPGVVLMENAGRGAADVLERELLGGEARGKQIGVVCGVGNNGGDGFVIARHLALRGATVQVALVGDPARCRGDAAIARGAWLGTGGVIGTAPEALSECDVLVDALFGTGLDREVTGEQAAAIAFLNGSAAPVFALDLPSGLDADTGTTLGACVNARVTVTFAHSKCGLLTPSGAARAGRVFVVDIGVPAALVVGAGHEAWLMSDQDARAWLPARAAGSHKHGAGHVGVLAGSSGKPGAAMLAASGALRAGAGLATIVTWPEVAAALELRALEIMVSRIDEADVEASVDRAVAGKRALVIGPAFGLGDAAHRAVSRAVNAFEGVAVLDADALTLFAGRPQVLASSCARLVLTPHAGEAARLLGVTSAQVEADRFGAVRELAAAAGCVVLLKGAHTLIADARGRVAVSRVVCPALATAGSGDVLAGIIAGLGCGLGAFEAACAGALIHGKAGEAAGVDRGLLASEIADLVPRAIRALSAGHDVRP